MTNALSVLILSQDSTLLATDGTTPSDTRRRHIRYAEILQARHPGSRLRIVTLARRAADARVDQPRPFLTIVGVRPLLRVTYLASLWFALRRIHAEGWRPDVITAQTPWEEALVGLAFARRWRVPFLSQFHSDFFGDGFRRERWSHELLYRISRRVARLSNHVRVVSTGVRDAIVAAGCASAEHISVVPVPVDFTPALHEPTAAATPMVLFVGRLVGVKDLTLWLDTAAGIARACPGARFVIAGDGPEKVSLEARARELGLNVSFPGAVDHRDLPQLYAQASVFLLTSQYEGLGRVVVEAMLSGVPVVSVDIVGPRDLISDGKTGRLVTERSAAALSQAVVDLLNDRPNAQRMATEALVQAERTFAFDSVAGCLVDLWARVAALRP